jgi:hypothetical protein
MEMKRSLFPDGPEYALTDPEYFLPYEWTYLYDHSPLVNTLEKYIDYNKLQSNGKPNARLIITAVNVLTSEPLGFIDELYHVIQDRFDLEDKEEKEKFEKIKAKYKKISEEHGAQIKGLYYISRDEPFPTGCNLNLSSFIYVSPNKA